MSTTVQNDPLLRGRLLAELQFGHTRSVREIAWSLLLGEGVLWGTLCFLFFGGYCVQVAEALDELCEMGLAVKEQQDIAPTFYEQVALASNGIFSATPTHAFNFCSYKKTLKVDAPVNATALVA